MASSQSPYGTHTVVKKRNLKIRRLQIYFFLDEWSNSFLYHWQKELSRHHRAKMICNSRAVKFLFWPLYWTELTVVLMRVEWFVLKVSDRVGFICVGIQMYSVSDYYLNYFRSLSLINILSWLWYFRCGMTRYYQRGSYWYFGRHGSSMEVFLKTSPGINLFSPKKHPPMVLLQWVYDLPTWCLEI